MSAISKLAQIAITVSNVSVALGFYRDILGLNLLFSPSDNLAFLSCGDTRVMLTTPQGYGEIGKNSIMYFSVKDIETTFGKMLDKGAELERFPQLSANMPDHELWIGFLKDPDGNLIGLMEEKSLKNTGI